MSILITGIMGDCEPQWGYWAVNSVFRERAASALNNWGLCSVPLFSIETRRRTPLRFVILSSLYRAFDQDTSVPLVSLWWKGWLSRLNH